MKKREVGVIITGICLLIFSPSCLVRKSTYQLKTDELDIIQSEYETLDKKHQEVTQEIDQLRKANTELIEQARNLQGNVNTLKDQKIEAVAKVEDTYSDLVNDLQKEIDMKQVKIVQMKGRLSVNIVQKILFDSGRTDIKTSGFDVLNKVGESLKNIKNKQIQIEGHTDNVPITGRLQNRYPTNWELSVARAVKVTRYLQEVVGIDPARLSAAGFSEYQPVDDSDTPEGYAENRRIEIVLLPLHGKKVLQDSSFQ